jgi:hypothetical protein
MRKKSFSKSGLFDRRTLLALALCSVSVWLGLLSLASTPSTGTLSDVNPVLTYDAGPFNVANQSPLGLGQLDTGPRCDAADPCDSYTLTVTLPTGYAAAHPNGAVKATMYWTDTGSGQSNYDLYIYNGTNPTVDGNHPADHQSASNANPEVAVINPLIDGTTQYTLEIVPNTPTQETVHVRIELLPGTGGLNANFGGPDPSAPGVPRYQNFIPPESSSAESSRGEFNIGFNPASKRIMTMNSGPIWRLTPHEVQFPGQPECCEALWEDRSAVTTNTPADLDPILWTDQKTGRTFASNSTAGANASYAYSDSDGDPSMTQPTGWTEAGFSPPDGGADHETIGSGPYPLVAGLPNPLATAVNHGEMVFYCSQDIVGPASCQRSDDLGVSYGTGVLAYTGNGLHQTVPGVPGGPCGGLHGHIHVAPDGTAWLPVNQCGGLQGGVFSTDSGITWTNFTVPNAFSQQQGADPSIAIDANSTIYYAYVNNEPVTSGNPPEGHARVQVGHRNADNTINWTNNFDLGATHGIKNGAEIEAVGGSAGRAAVGFFGTDVNGDYQALSFPGKWYPFIATTYDGGQTWTTVNATPNDPIQSMTGIWQQGGSAQDRNLLDFNEITIDDKGRVLFGYSDGCVTPGCISGAAPNDFVAHMRVARQSGGKTLFASYDSNTDTTTAKVPKPACLSGIRDSLASHLTWKVPDSGGADIIRYEIWRGTSPGNETKLFTTLNPNPHYTDLSPPSDQHLYYYVKAINGIGTGTQSNEINLVVQTPPTHCTLPGILAVNDLNPDGSDNDSGQNTPPDPRVNIRQLFVAEPFLGPGVNKLVFTMQMAPSPTLTSPPPSSQWYIIWNRQTIAADGSDRFYVAMKTDATGTVSYEYGNFGPPLPIGGVPPPNANTPTPLGAADSGTYDVVNGVVTITLSDSVAENIHAGQTLSALNVRTYLARPDAGQRSQNNANDITPDGSYTLVGNDICAPNIVPILSVFSAKTHGSVGEFDIPLPYTGNAQPAGIECRAPGNNNSHTIVFNFVNPLTSVGSATVASGAATMDTANSGINANNAHEYVVTLTGVANAQRVIVMLNNVADGLGNSATSISTTMGVLLGDTTENGLVNSSDIAQTQSQSGQPIGPNNFREDVTVNGLINSSDIALVQSMSGTGLPTSPATTTRQSKTSGIKNRSPDRAH